MNKRSGKSSSRGYSLVEISIVLVVIGLAFGGALLPVYNRIELENEASVEDAMRQIKLAMLDYAGRQRTAGRWVENNDSIYRLPAGRPYLPCPDIDGDGVENRNDLLNDDLANPEDWDELESIDAGGCEEYKGTMPWRTLNLAQYADDIWGRRYTYRVDPAYANSLIGFSEATFADKYDLRRTLTLRSGNAEYEFRPNAFPSPGIICGASPDPAVDIEFPCEADTTGVFIIAGDVTAVAVTLASRPFRPYDANDIISGVPAVIVSHGANGYGGIISGGVAESEDLICVPFPDGTSPDAEYNAERQNAFRSTAVIAGDSDCPAIPLNGGGGSESGFYTGPHSETEEIVFDDIVVWISAEELTGEMSRVGVFPAADFPRIGLEN